MKIFINKNNIIKFIFRTFINSFKLLLIDFLFKRC